MEIKELLELFIKEKYEDLIKSADESEDVTSKFLKVRSYFALGKYNQALQQFYLYQDLLLKKNFIEAIKLLVSLLIANNYSLEDTLNLINSYKNYTQQNYESQQFVGRIDEYIKIEFQMNIESKKDYIFDETEFLKTLENGSYDDIVSSLNYLKFNDEILFNYLETIVNYIKNHPRFDYKFGLLLRELILNKYDEKILLLKNDNYFVICPKNYYDSIIKQNMLIESIVSNVSNDLNDVTINHYVTKIIDMTQDSFAPDYLNEYEECLIYVSAVLCVVFRLLGKEPFSNHFILESCKLDEEKFKNYYAEIFKLIPIISK